MVISPSALTIAERQRRAMYLRKIGKSYQQIADELLVSVGTVTRDIQEAMNLVKFEGKEEVLEFRRMVIDRNHDAILAIYESVVAGDLLAIDRLIKLNEQLINLVGASVSRHDVTSDGKPLVSSIHTIEVVLNDGNKKAE